MEASRFKNRKKTVKEKEKSTSETSFYKQIALHEIMDRIKVWEANDP